MQLLLYLQIAIIAFFGIFAYQMIAGFWAGNALATADKAAQTKKQRQRMKVVIKMFFVMGLSWIADIVSWGLAEALNNLEIYKNVSLRYTTLVFQIINSSQVSKQIFEIFFARILLLQFRD